MRSVPYSQAFLSLFTDTNRAASIVGDVLEESNQRSGVWYLLQIIGIAASLCLNNFRSAPLRCLGVGGLALGVWIGVYAGLFVASGLPWYPWQRVNQPEFWTRLCIVLVFANLVAGYVVGRWVSVKGINGVGPLVVLLLSLQLILATTGALMSPLPQGLPAYAVRLLVMAVVFPTLVVSPQVIGSTLAKRGQIERRPASG